MTNVKRWLLNENSIWIVSLAIVFLISGCGVEVPAVQPRIEGLAQTIAEEPDLVASKDKAASEAQNRIDSRRFMNQVSFETSVEEAEDVVISQNIMGAIVPHHDVAAYMMADVFHSISNVKQPDLIVILAPNHYGLDRTFQLCDYDYETYTSVVKRDQATLSLLDEYPFFEYSPLVVASKEHGVNILMNYIGYYFPNSQVVPVILGDPRDPQELIAVSEALKKLTETKDCLFIASVDFSHYLTLEKAEENDRFTETLLLEMDTHKLITLSDDYIDSPLAIVTLIKIVEALGGKQSRVLDHNNMAVILDQPDLKSTTSYFTVVYE